MIVAWMKGDEPVYLDGTESHLGLCETPERIQGRQVIIENGDGYLLDTIPVTGHSQNTATEHRILEVDSNDLIGKVRHVFRGENKATVLFALHNIPKEQHEDVLRKFLSGANPAYQISNLKTSNLGDCNQELVIEYDLRHKGVITRFGKEIYMDLDNRKAFSDHVIDIAGHNLPYVFPFKDHRKLEIVVTLPEGTATRSLPGPIRLTKEGYSYNGSWTRKGNELRYISENWMDQTFIPVKQFPEFNSDLQLLIAFYNAQPELSF
jgi:hypothetical protein